MSYIESVKSLFSKSITKKNKPTKKTTDKINLKNTVVIDQGANSYKVCSSKNKLTYKSSKEEVDIDTVMLEQNVITINNRTYKIGTDKISQSSETLKYKKEYTELMLYGIAKLDLLEKFDKNKSGIKEIDVYILVPKSQLNTKDYYAVELDNKLYKCKVNGHEEVKYKLHFKRLFAEGLSSYNALDSKTLKNIEGLIIANMGMSTIDVFNLNSELAEESNGVLNMGARHILFELMQELSNHNLALDNSNMVNKYLLSGGELTKPQQKCVIKVKNAFVVEMYKELRSIFLNANKNTTVLFVGGTALMLKKELTEFFKKNNKNLKIKFLSDEDSIFADCIGAMEFVKLQYKKNSKVKKAVTK